MLFNNKYKIKIQDLEKQLLDSKEELELKSKTIENKRQDCIEKDTKISTLLKEITQLNSTIDLQKIKIKDFDYNSKEFFEYLELKNNIHQSQQTLDDLGFYIKEENSKLESIKREFIEKSALVEEYGDFIHLKSIGIYYPKFDYGTPQDYKDAIKEIRVKQKSFIKSNGICKSTQAFSYNGSSRVGDTIVKSLIKLGSTIYTLSIDNIIKRINHANMQKSLLDIDELFNKLNDTFSLMAIEFNFEYKDMKKDEARLVYELELSKQKEREELAEQREILREQAIIEKEIAEEKIRLENEKIGLMKQWADSDENKNEIGDRILEIDDKIKQGESRLTNQKFGWVYCISNPSIVGSLKVGITRRLDGMLRVEELGATAGLPFKYVCHCMAFSDDCFRDEKELHEMFADKKVNLFNTRKEHFYITLDEAEKAFKDRFGDIEFNKDAVNEDYIYSEEIRVGMVSESII